MKNFSLKKFLENPKQKIITRSEKPVRIICTDRNSIYPIVALVEQEDTELIYFYDTDGTNSINNSNLDLMFDTNHIGYIGIYKINDNNEFHTTKVYENRIEAEKDILSFPCCLDNVDITETHIVKIKWED